MALRSFYIKNRDPRLSRSKVALNDVAVDVPTASTAAHRAPETLLANGSDSQEFPRNPDGSSRSNIGPTLQRSASAPSNVPGTLFSLATGSSSSSLSSSSRMYDQKWKPDRSLERKYPSFDELDFDQNNDRRNYGTGNSRIQEESLKRRLAIPAKPNEISNGSTRFQEDGYRERDATMDRRGRPQSRETRQPVAPSNTLRERFEKERSGEQYHRRSVSPVNDHRSKWSREAKETMEGDPGWRRASPEYEAAGERRRRSRSPSFEPVRERRRRSRSPLPQDRRNPLKDFEPVRKARRRSESPPGRRGSLDRSSLIESRRPRDGFRSSSEYSKRKRGDSSGSDLESPPKKSLRSSEVFNVAQSDIYDITDALTPQNAKLSGIKLRSLKDLGITGTKEVLSSVTLKKKRVTVTSVFHFIKDLDGKDHKADFCCNVMNALMYLLSSNASSISINYHLNHSQMPQDAMLKERSAIGTGAISLLYQIYQGLMTGDNSTYSRAMRKYEVNRGKGKLYESVFRCFERNHFINPNQRTLPDELGLDRESSGSPREPSPEIIRRPVEAFTQEKLKRITDALSPDSYLQNGIEVPMAGTKLTMEEITRFARIHKNSVEINYRITLIDGIHSV